MGRHKLQLTDAERKEKLRQKNARYYERMKEKWVNTYNSKDASYSGSVVYAIKGLPDDKIYIGATKCFQRRVKEHEKIFGGAITAEIVIRFPEEIKDIGLMNYFEHLVIRYYGIDKVVNKNNTFAHSKETLQLIKERVKDTLEKLDDKHKSIINEALDNYTPAVVSMYH